MSSKPMSAEAGEKQSRRSPQGRDLSSEMELSSTVIELFRQYAREKPEAAAAWCFGIGFVLGWKLKPW